MKPKLESKVLPVLVETEPYNAETPLEALVRKNITPNESFYLRNHFTIPTIDPATWKLSVSGAVQNQLALSLSQIRGMRARTLVVTLECAGNGRTRMQPLPPSTPWRDGAVATAEWTGVPLRDVLEKARPQNNIVEVLFRGADAGMEAGRELAFERSLPIDAALHEDVLLVYEMNGRPLPKAHGFPLRLIVPGWYGVASVKWLIEIRALNEPFQGYYQKERYIYADGGKEPHLPVTGMHVKSLILEPAEDAVLKRGRPYKVVGLAWSGLSRITRVEFKTHNSQWAGAELSEDVGRYAWRRWFTTWTPQQPGRYALLSRAHDEASSQQPSEPVWNLYGYGYNTVTTRSIRVI